HNDEIKVIPEENSTMSAQISVKPPAKAVTRALNAPSNEAIEQYYTGMRNFWHPVLPVADLPADRPIGVELLGEMIVLAWLNGQIVAMQDLCRHFQAQLSLGEIFSLPDGQQCLMCKYHGWRYGNTG